MRRYLMGFSCVNRQLGLGCECTIDTPECVKVNFKREHGLPYDEFCYYDLAEAADAKQALESAYEQQGATEEETAREIWPQVRMVSEVTKAAGA